MGASWIQNWPPLQRLNLSSKRSRGFSENSCRMLSLYAVFSFRQAKCGRHRSVMNCHDLSGQQCLGLIARFDALERRRFWTRRATGLSWLRSSRGMLAGYPRHRRNRVGPIPTKFSAVGRNKCECDKQDAKYHCKNCSIFPLRVVLSPVIHGRRSPT